MIGDAEDLPLKEQLDANEDELLATAVEAVLTGPNNMQQYRHRPHIALKVFNGILEERPRALPKLFEAARYSETPACWAALVDHAKRTGQADRLAMLFMRLRKPWRGDLDQFGIQFRRLSAMLSPRFARDMIRACNPRKRLWLNKLVDFDILWAVVVCGFVERREYRRAHDAVLQAGRGYLVRRDDVNFMALSPRVRAFYTDAKDWRQSDSLVWRTYGRASDLAPLVRIVWDAHVSAGIFARGQHPTTEGLESVPVSVISQDGESAMRSTAKVPFVGLICRFAENPSCARLLHDRFALAPVLKGARLNEVGAMLQELVIYYDVQRVLPMRSPEEKRHVPRNVFRPLAKCR